MGREYKRCNACKEWHYTDEECPPIYKVSMSDYDPGDYSEIRASSFSEAAEIFSREYNNESDDSILNEPIFMKIEKDEEIKYYHVSCEVDILYYTAETYASGERL